jgi:hypothetical protein
LEQFKFFVCNDGTCGSDKKRALKAPKGKKKMIQTIQHVKKTKGIQKYLKKQNVDYWLWVIPSNKNLNGYALHYFNIINNQMKMRLA